MQKWRKNVSERMRSRKRKGTMQSEREEVPVGNHFILKGQLVEKVQMGLVNYRYSIS
jgi:hypothetical protein